MFKVKATVVDFLGDKERYPCHHQYKLGDEFIFDGASFTGTICPSFAITVVHRMIDSGGGSPVQGLSVLLPVFICPFECG
jgi:uncharacterized repeat protein (TIGR04076 family)